MSPLPAHESPRGHALARVVVVGLGGPLYALAGHLGGGLGARLGLSALLAVVALAVSRTLILRDADVARRMRHGMGPWLVAEATVVFMVVLLCLAQARTSAAAGMGSALAAAIVWAGGYASLLGGAAVSTRQVDDEPRLVRQVQTSALDADVALLLPALAILAQLRQESLNSGSLLEVVVLPLVGWIPFALAYIPVARFRLAAVGGHLPSELLVMFSSYYAFMLTPLPSAL